MAAKVRDGHYRCPGPCGQVKPRSDFYAPRTKSTEVSHYCKVCECGRRKENRERTNRLRAGE